MFRSILSSLLLILIFSTASAYDGADTINIYFHIGSAQLTLQSKHTIDSLMYNDILAPGRKVGLIGYADIIGGEQSNQILSTQRAKAVELYLLQMNIDSGDIESVTGKGAINRPQRQGGYPEDRKVSIIPGGFKKLAEGKKVIKGQKKLGDLIHYVRDTPVIDIEQVDVNSLFKLDRVYFRLGKSDLLPQSMPMMNALYKLMHDNPTLTIQVEGHVCCAEPYNIVNDKRIPIPEGAIDTNAFTALEDLSVHRAFSVYAFLVWEKKIDKSRIRYIGYGTKKMLVKPELTEEDRAANRRVEIRITGK